MSLDVTQLELGPFAVNCYVVRAAGGNEGVVVDPGWPGAWTDIESALGDSRCAAILITHGDIDHVAGVAEVARASGAPVHIAAEESDRLERINDFVPAGLEGVALEPYAADGCLFSGDVLFAGSVGRVDRPNGDWETLLASIRQLAERFPPETIVYPGHGPQTTLERELDTNPFLAELRART